MKLKTTISILTLFTFFTLYSQEKYVFFGSFNRDKTAEGIYVYILDTISGNLSKVTSLKGVLNPSYLTLSPNGKFLFACTESKTVNAGSVSSFEFNPINKTLTYINNQSSGGENPVYLTVHKNGKWLINANFTEGSLSVYPISVEGNIDSIVQNIQFTEGSIDKERQNRAHIHSAVFSPNFDYIFCPDLGADKIRCYKFENEKNKPLETPEKPYTESTLGSGPRHFTFHPNGKFAYCIEELLGTISVYNYNEGILDSLQRIKTHPKNIKEGFESSDIHISPDGKFLYATNRGKENNIAIFSIQNDGQLSIVDYQSTMGKHPRIFAIDESGKFLIVSNVNSGNVIVFRIDTKTGLLKKTGKEITIKNVSCVQIRNYK